MYPGGFLLGSVVVADTDADVVAGTDEGAWDGEPAEQPEARMGVSSTAAIPSRERVAFIAPLLRLRCRATPSAIALTLATDLSLRCRTECVEHHVVE